MDLFKRISAAFNGSKKNKFILMIKKFLTARKNSSVLLHLFCVIILILAFMSAVLPQLGSAEGDGFSVLTTTTMLYDLAKEIAGDCAEVDCLMGSGVDPHQYKASASDIVKLQNADAVICNGLSLEGKMADVLSSLGATGKTVICVADGVSEELLLEKDGVFDPHIWFDVSLWKMAAEELCEGLCAADPDNSQNYLENLLAYKESLSDLENYIEEKLSVLPKEKRVLITAHDAFAYFAREWDFTVMGLQGISTAAQAAASDVGRLADFIAENRVNAVFAETSLPVKNLQALIEAVRARGFSADIGGDLYGDSLGDEKSGTATYIDAYKHNIDTIVDGLAE